MAAADSTAATYLRVIAGGVLKELHMESPQRYVVRLPEPAAATVQWLEQCAPRSGDEKPIRTP